MAKKQNKVVPGTPEILGAMGAHDEKLIKDATAKMDTDIKTVANKEDEVNVTLPYYSNLGDKASAVSDSELATAVGAASSADIKRAQNYIAANIDIDILKEQGVSGFSYNVDDVVAAMDAGEPVPVSFTVREEFQQKQGK